MGPGITAIFGPSGSGKSTTLSCIAGITRPDLGEIVLNGRVLFSARRGVSEPPERRRIGFVYQDGALFPHMTAGANVRYGHDLLAPSKRRLDLKLIVELLGLGPMLERDVNSLSGGEAQRVAIARALAVSPELLLLDEPLASLDARLRGVVLGYLRRVHDEFGIPILYVSHSISEVVSLAQHALVLRDGRSIAFDRPTRLLLEGAAGASVEEEVFENLIEGEVVEPGGGGRTGLVRAAGVEIATPVTGRPRGAWVMLSLGADDVMLATSRPVGLSARNCLPATLTELRTAGDRVFAVADMGTELIVELTVGAVRELGLSVGAAVYLVFKSSSVRVLEAPATTSQSRRSVAQTRPARAITGNGQGEP